MMASTLKIVACFVFLVYMTGALSFSSSFLLDSTLNTCVVCTETPAGDVPHSDENGQDMPCESEETEEEFKEVSLASESSGLHFSHLSNKYYNFQQVTLFAPFRSIFSPPPEAFLAS